MNKDVWEGPIYVCSKCSQELQSRYEGEFVSCICGNFIDSTKLYTRIGGSGLTLKTDDKQDILHK